MILATCYSVEACLQARLVMQPLANDDVVQETFIRSSSKSSMPISRAKPGQDGIIYMFAVPNCGIDMGARAYTTTGLLEAA